MKNLADSFLNHITMYRLVLYYLAALAVISLALGLVTAAPVDPLLFLFSALLITSVCWLINRTFARVLRLPVNAESIYITALILALVMPPVSWTDTTGMAGLAVASAVAIASKFILAFRGKHVFNPVAAGIFASAMLLDQPATWWVAGNLVLLPAVVLGGLLMLRKVQRFAMFGIYAAANIVVTLATTTPDMYTEALWQTLAYSPLLFAGFAMLTEPLTAPQSKLPSWIFGAIVGALSSPGIHIGDFYSTPEIAFLAGNVFAFVASPMGRVRLTLLRVEELAAGSYNYIFRPDRPLSFRAGQYLDWTMHVANPDNRGNRRSFTIASAPTEREIHLGVKFYPEPSAFKQALLDMMPGDVIYGSQLAGEFTLPRNQHEKLVFIAGGIGVTPFRSMLQDMIDRKDHRSVVMFYGNNTENEIAYADVLNRAEREIGIRTVYAVASGHSRRNNVHTGYIDSALIQKEVPDFRDRTFFLSGPRAMVVNFEKVLRELGIAGARIKVDYFPGFA